MAEEMRLKGVVGQDLVVPGQKLNCNSRLNNEANSNEIPNSDDNCTNRYCRQWSNCDELVSGKADSDDNRFCESHVNSNNNIAVERSETERGRRVVSCSSPVSSQEDDSYADYEGQSSSSIDVSPQGDEYHCFSQEEITDSDFSDDGNHYPNGSYANRGIHNPNYPGFQEFANDLEDSDYDEIGSNINNNNNNNNNNGNIEISESVNHLDSVENFQKAFYDKPKFDIVNCESESDAKPENCEKVENGEAFARETSVAQKENLFGEAPPDSGVSSGVTTDNELECPENGNWFVQEDIVKTTVYPVSGIYETAILTDDDSDSSPTEEKPAEMASPACEENHLDRVTYEKCDPEDEKSKLDDLIRESNKLGEERKKEGWDKELKETENERKAEETMKKEEKTQINVTTKNNLKGKSAESHVTYRGGKDKQQRSSVGNRRTVPLSRDKGSNVDLGFFDVYNIETAMPKIDIDAIESHLKAAKEEERRSKVKEKLSPSNDNVEHNPIPLSPETPVKISNRSVEMKWHSSLPQEMQWVAQVPNDEESEDIVERFTYISDSRNFHMRTDREEIRRRLAMGTDSDDYYGGERTFRKPNLQTRLQSGMNLQICFMNETMSDNESPNSDSELGNSVCNVDNSPEEKSITKRPDTLAVNKNNGSIPANHVRPSTSLLTLPLKKEYEFKSKALTATDFFSCQAQLQAEARLALSQAKEMARMQMEVERQKLQTSPITEMVRSSLEKVGIPFPQDRRRLSRQILTEMNIAQLQVIVNDLHTQIEKLNENLVKFLIGRDDLHMEQDSMLVDIEDLTRYLEAKEKPQDVPNMNMVNRNNNINRTQNQNRISINDVRSKD